MFTRRSVHICINSVVRQSTVLFVLLNMVELLFSPDHSIMVHYGQMRMVCTGCIPAAKKHIGKSTSVGLALGQFCMMHRVGRLYRVLKTCQMPHREGLFPQRGLQVMADLEKQTCKIN